MNERSVVVEVISIVKFNQTEFGRVVNMVSYRQLITTS
jgi:hypothetical protein